jgi:hypothetical protein
MHATMQELVEGIFSILTALNAYKWTQCPGKMSASRGRGCYDVLFCHSRCTIYIYIRIIDKNQKPRFYLGLFLDDTTIYVRDQREGMFSESCSEVSVLLRRGVSVE